MSTQDVYDNHTGTEHAQLDYHAIAARLECDGEELRLFVTNHPNPTAPAVLGWAEADPTHREAVERWLGVREDRTAARTDDLLDDLDTEAETRYSALKDGGSE